jgi:hypothetical protein
MARSFLTKEERQQQRELEAKLVAKRNAKREESFQKRVQKSCVKSSYTGLDNKEYLADLGFMRFDQEPQLGKIRRLESRIKQAKAARREKHGRLETITKKQSGGEYELYK